MTGGPYHARHLLYPGNQRLRLDPAPAATHLPPRPAQTAVALRVGTVCPSRHRGTADLAAARHGGSDARRRGRRGIYDAKFKELTREKADLQAQVDAVEQAARQDQDRQRELQAVLNAIEQQPVELERYDDELVRRIIKRIEVMQGGTLSISFTGAVRKDNATDLSG